MQKLFCAALFVFIATQVAASDLYDYGRSPVVQLTDLNFKSHVVDSNETWFVEFYAPWCGHCRNLVPAWEKAADHMKGIVFFGGVNCDDNRELASKYGIRGFPTIKVFKGSGVKARRPTEYQGGRNAKSLVEQAKWELPNNVVEIKSGGIESFLEDEKHIPHVILFTDKTTTSSLYKSLSSAYLGKVSLGEIRRKEAEAIKSKFDVSSYPTFVYFQAGATPEDGNKYSGSTDADTLRSFLSSLIGKGEFRGSDGETIDPNNVKASEEVKQTFYKPQEHQVGVEMISDGDSLAKFCTKRLDGSTCVAAFVKNAKSLGSIKADFASLSEKYRFDNLAFTVIDAAAHPEGADVAESLEVDLSIGIAVVAVRSRRSKYAVMENVGDAITDVTVSSFLDRILGGDIRYKRMPDEMPQWTAASGATGQGSTDAENGSTEEAVQTGDDGGVGKQEEQDESVGDGEIPPKADKASAREFGPGSENDPQVHPGEKCEAGGGEHDGHKEDL
eukprot:Plantae.Rhodophyta-Purpureofilum_apyrenoidigerum.ctg2515.p1 GENE.Plantae.Rhodophyta-Purpureofilum_apyrenoidigerum.ctg2515~~Plantae.Rhodophyta-Purpureofilum_apyrenoidigerum.ctg2515.p1  ORF type:complete len:501 (+),score=107.19 Plantae.Rhodophyta-Purpureofilum_apyrenoidigerum.ctg2515:180-1682(+)